MNDNINKTFINREEIHKKRKLKKEKDIDYKIIKLLKEALALLERKYED